uniref:SAP domain-containing protein n=1 Tax=Anopheles dirus TaxID=7168 RepID=A0A182NN65_9DIPT
MDLAKLKVADLKAELAARNLDTKGVKAVLLERLKEAIERETNAAANVDLSSQQQQYLAQQQHRQQLLLQQQLQAQQQLHAQQQLFIQQQQLQQQQQQQHQLEQQNVVVADSEQPQEQTIEDLSMPSKRADTPARRRSTRRSMTRSPSPTNSSVENPHASLMGSARKRGRSRSMTKSPSPQRLTSEAPCLASVQEEEPEPTVAPVPVTEQRLAVTEVAPVATEVEHEEPKNVTDAADVASAPSPSDSIPQSKIEEPEPSSAAPSAMDVEEGDPIHESLQTVAKDDSVAEDILQQTAAASSNETPTEEKDIGSPAPALSKGDEVKAAGEESVKNTETCDSGAKAAETPSTAAAEATASDKSIATGATKAEKKQSGPQQAQSNVVEFVSEENEPKLPDEAANTVLLNDSDLNLTIDDKDLLSAKPLSDGIFGLVWGGVRANRGVTDGKVFYEVLVTDELQPATRSPLIPEGETPTPEMRIGWSTVAEGKRQLGEMDHAYGYSSCGKKVVGGNFEQYGIAYGKNDVVGVYLDMDTSQCRLQFTVNHVRQGTAFEFDKESLAGQALFPHVYAKNLSFKVNFGSVADGFPLVEKTVASKTTNETDKPTEKTEVVTSEVEKDEATTDVKQQTENADAEDDTKQPEDVKVEEAEDIKPASDASSSAESVPFDENFKFLNRFVEENQTSVVDGLKGPAARDCCELIMMIGLPGCGKTTWVQNYLKENSETSFTLLSVDSLLDNMKVTGKARDPSNTPQWQKIVEQLSRNMARLIEIACKRRRHLLLDQTNVFASEQKRRLKGFGGFKKRRAVAVVPSVEEYKRRYELKVAKYGKEVPETTLNTMKANIFVPSLVQNWYTEIAFAEQPEAEAQDTIKKLNEEGRKLLPPRRNRANQSNRQKHASNNSNANSNYTSRWSQNRPQGGVGQQYGKNRYGSGGGGGGGGASGYNRYGNKPHEVGNQYGHHRVGDYRSGNGYGRRDDHHRGGANYGGGGNRYDSWNRNSGGSGYYNDRGYPNRGYNQQQQDHSNRYDARRRDRRGYNNNGSGWNAQGGQSQQWNNSYPKSGSSESWYLWWQSNLNNLLAPNGSNADGSATSSSQWNQYGGNSTHQSSSYSNYHSKGSGAGSSGMS